MMMMITMVMLCYQVVSNRFDGSVDFNRMWLDYEDGFGNKEGEYWLGAISSAQTIHHNFKQ
jgi:hypothetical protein